MHRIDTVGHQGNKFVDADPAQGISGTVVNDEWLNATQEELINAITQHGLTPDKDNQGQIAEVLRRYPFTVDSIVEGLHKVPSPLLVEGVHFAAASRYVGGSAKGGGFVWRASRAKSQHDGIFIVSNTVPPLSEQANEDDFNNGVGETSPSGTGVFVAVGSGFLKIGISDFGDRIADAAIYADKTGLNVDLEGRIIAHSEFISDYYKCFHNGFILVSGIAYPVNVWGFSSSTLASLDVSAGSNANGITDLQYSAWPQGKVWKQERNGRRKMLINRGTDHNSGNLNVWSLTFGAAGEAFEPVVESPKVAGYSQGNTSWSAGTDGVREYFITRERGASYAIGSTRHVLNYSAFASADNGGYVSKEISLDDGLEVPVLFHSFARLGDGRLAFGVHYNSGQVGLAFTDSDSTVGDTWTFTEMFASGDYVEPSIYHDIDLGITVGFLRTQSTSTKPKFWVSSDNCATFSFSDLEDIPSQAFVMSPINIHKADGKYYAFVTERSGSARMYLLIADASEVVANGASAFQAYFVGNGNFEGSGASGAGAGDLYATENKVTLYYGEHQSVDNADVVAVKGLEISFTPNLSKVIPNAFSSSRLPYTEVHELTGLGSAWGPDASGEGAAVNGGGLFLAISGSGLRLYGALETTDATQAIVTLPTRFIPFVSHKRAVVHSDSDVAILFVRGVLSGGASGEVKLVNQTGSLTKVNIDISFDILN